MRVVIQRVTDCSVTISNKIHSQIGKGLLVLTAFEEGDAESDIDWMCNKIVNLRVFDDENGVMNRSVIDIKGDIMIVSQFTLYASTRKGNRPSYLRAAPPHIAVPLYEILLKKIETILGKYPKSGIFGEDMKVSFTNDGPTTIIIDTKNKE